jgi:uncharacterized protein (TIGR02271 family)
MTSTFNPQDLIGRTAIDSAGDKIGKIGQIYLDDQTGEPAWVTVSTGMFGTKESFAPVSGSTTTADGDLQLGVTKDQIKDAPNVDSDGHIGEDEQSTLYGYYGQYLGSYQTGTTTTDTTSGSDTTTTGRGSDNAMTRSEEQLQVGTEQVQTGRARLRKYVVTENVTQTVPVSHEEVRIEREPITDANVGDATDGPAISEAEHEVTLHAERPVVAKEAVPVERVRMDTETVTEQAQVSEEVRKEQIEVDGDTDRRV